MIRIRAVVSCAVLLALLLLQGCSVSRLAYNNGDVFLRWQANHYFDLEGDQVEELDRVIAAAYAWHRAKALPQYARLGEEAATRLARGLRRDDLEWAYDSVRTQAREALGVAAAESAGLLDRLSPEQIAHFEQRLSEENRKFARENIQGSMEQRNQRRVKRNLERLEEWFGRLDEAQVERVRAYSARAPFTAEMRDRDRRRRQAEFIAMLRAKEARQRLPRWAEDWEAGREPAYAEASRASVSAYYHLMLELDRSLTSEQRDHAVRRLRRYAALFESLSRQP